MASLEPGDVVLVRFPFTNLQAVKQRPAVVVSSRAYNEQRPDVPLLAITSRIKAPLDFAEVMLDDWERAGLARPSVFKPIIASIEQQPVVGVLGRCSDSDRGHLRNLLRAILAL
jgi:mRNA interferase MazF